MIFLIKCFPLSRMILKVCLLWCAVSLINAKKSKSSELISITDLKDWKKELRTKKNVLALFTKVTIVTELTFYQHLTNLHS